jgi:hypothetical protein
MKKIITTLVLGSFFLIGNAVAMDSTSHDHAQHDGGQAAMDQGKTQSMDHGTVDHSPAQDGGTFKQAVMVDGIHAEFQIMDLAGMNMTDPEGRTHHVMVSFMKSDQKITKAVGKVKIIAPSGKEELADLQDFGSGVFAANFTFDEEGKWGVICLFKDADGKHTAKFWYQHGMKYRLFGKIFPGYCRGIFSFSGLSRGIFILKTAPPFSFCSYKRSPPMSRRAFLPEERESPYPSVFVVKNTLNNFSSFSFETPGPESDTSNRQKSALRPDRNTMDWPFGEKSIALSTNESMTLGTASFMTMDGHPPSTRSTTTFIPFVAAFRL